VVAGDVRLPLNMAALAKSQSETLFTNRVGGWLVMGGRLQPGVSLSAAAAELDAIGRALRRDSPDQTSAANLRLHRGERCHNYC
jgi:hypothetical protein